MGKQSSESYSVGRTRELAPGEVRQIDVGGRVLALYNIDGTLYATDDTCTHALASYGMAADNVAARSTRLGRS